jgi:hypothetical protein
MKVRLVYLGSNNARVSDDTPVILLRMLYHFTNIFIELVTLIYHPLVAAMVCFGVFIACLTDVAT